MSGGTIGPGAAAGKRKRRAQNKVWFWAAECKYPVSNRRDLLSYSRSPGHHERRQATGMAPRE